MFGFLFLLQFCKLSYIYWDGGPWPGAEEMAGRGWDTRCQAFKGRQMAAKGLGWPPDAGGREGPWPRLGHSPDPSWVGMGLRTETSAAEALASHAWGFWPFWTEGMISGALES